MTDKPLFTRVLENNGDKLYFLSCTKCGRRKEDCPHLKLALQECPLNAHRVPFLGHQFSKNRQLRPLFLAYFYLPKITKPL